MKTNINVRRQALSDMKEMLDEMKADKNHNDTGDLPNDNYVCTAKYFATPEATRMNRELGLFNINRSKK